MRAEVSWDPIRAILANDFTGQASALIARVPGALHGGIVCEKLS